MLAHNQGEAGAQQWMESVVGSVDQIDRFRLHEVELSYSYYS